MKRALISVGSVTAALALLVIGRACSGGSSTSQGSLEADVIALQAIMGDDPARVVLDEVEQAVDTERPVMAADLIDRAALPRTREQIERLQRAPATTPEGRQLRTRAVRLHRAREHALELYRDALARGIGTEDLDLIDAMQAYRTAEIDILALFDDLAEIRPLPREATERETRDAVLGGLPPIRHDEAREDEEAPSELPEPDEGAGEPREPLPER